MPGWPGCVGAIFRLGHRWMFVTRIRWRFLDWFGAAERPVTVVPVSLRCGGGR